MEDSEENINISEFINGDADSAEAVETENAETENVENSETVETVSETVVSSSYSNEDLKEMHRTILDFLEFISSEYEKNEE